MAQAKKIVRVIEPREQLRTDSTPGSKKGGNGGGAPTTSTVPDYSGLTEREKQQQKAAESKALAKLQGKFGGTEKASPQVRAAIEAASVKIEELRTKGLSDTQIIKELKKGGFSLEQQQVQPSFQLTGLQKARVDVVAGGLSPKAREAFLRKAGPEQREELLGGVPGGTIGLKGTVRIGPKGERQYVAPSVELEPEPNSIAELFRPSEAPPKELLVGVQPAKPAPKKRELFSIKEFFKGEYKREKELRQRSIGEITGFQEELKKVGKKAPSYVSFPLGAVETAYEIPKSAYEHPFATGGLIAGTLAFPTVGAFAGVGLGGLFAYKTTKEKAKSILGPSPAGEKAFALGEVGAALGLGALTIYSAVSSPKVTGFFRTAGREFVPPEQIIAPEILTGKKTFPTAPPKEHLNIFRKSKYLLPKEKKLGIYHAAPGKFKEKPIQAGTSEIAGLYGAPSVSAHFLKLRSADGYKLLGLTPFRRPTIARIYPAKLEIPKGLKKTSAGKQLEVVEAEKGVAYVPGIKTEIEAVIPPETKIKKIGSEYYTKVEGTRVPIERFEAIGEKELGITKGKIIKTKTIKGLSESIGRSSKRAIITPSSLAPYSSLKKKSSSILKPSKVSSKLFFEPSSKAPYKTPSKYPTSKISIKYPSYKPTKYISKVSPYGISKYPSYVPSYISKILPPPTITKSKFGLGKALRKQKPSAIFKLSKQVYKPSLGAVFFKKVATKAEARRLRKATFGATEQRLLLPGDPLTRRILGKSKGSSMFKPTRKWF